MKRKNRLLLGFILLLSSFNSKLILAATKTTTQPANSKIHSVQTLRAQWQDTERNRTVPYKIYFPDRLQAPVPVIIFSHGLGGSRDNYEYLGKHWASRGYIAVHLQHEGSDSQVWENKGVRNKAELLRILSQQANARNAINRAKDVSVALDQLVKMNASGALKGRLDLSRVGMAGHSFGANTTLLVSGQKLGFGNSLLDPRIKAVIPMSAPTPRNHSNLKSVYSAIKIPMFHMTGTEDDSPIGDGKAVDRLLPYQNISARNQYLLVFQGGDHMVFSGRRKSENPTQAAQDKTFQNLILQGSVAFWNAYLKNDSKAQEWLHRDFKKAVGKSGVFEHR